MMIYPPNEYHIRENQGKTECNLCNPAKRTFEVPYKHFRIEVGAFKTYEQAFDHQMLLFRQGFTTEIMLREKFFIVSAGDFPKLDEAVLLEQKLRLCGYNTTISAS